MNQKLLIKLGFASIILTTGAIAGWSQIGQASLTVEESQLNQPEVNKPEILLTQAVALMSGEFVAAEAPTTGTAQIVEENGQKYLKIDSAFSTTDQAPDLQILLDTASQAPDMYEEAEATRYLNLGGIQSVTGEQSYPIPDFVDTSQFKSVVIWCRMANATMGYASLTDSSSASLQ